MAQVEWRNVFDRAEWKRRNPATHSWNVGTNFPVALRGNAAGIIVSGPNGFRRIPEDVFLDSAHDTLPATTFIAASDGERTVVIASPTDFLFQNPLRDDARLVLRTMTIAQGFGPVGLRVAASQILPSLEPGDDTPIVHRYALCSHAGEFDARRSQQFAWSFRAEMPAVFSPNGLLLAGYEVSR